MMKDWTAMPVSGGCPSATSRPMPCARWASAMAKAKPMPVCSPSLSVSSGDEASCVDIGSFRLSARRTAPRRHLDD